MSVKNGELRNSQTSIPIRARKKKNGKIGRINFFRLLEINQRLSELLKRYILKKKAKSQYEQWTNVALTLQLAMFLPLVFLVLQESCRQIDSKHGEIQNPGSQQKETWRIGAPSKFHPQRIINCCLMVLWKILLLRSLFELSWSPLDMKRLLSEGVCVGNI